MAAGMLEILSAHSGENLRRCSRRQWKAGRQSDSVDRELALECHIGGRHLVERPRAAAAHIPDQRRLRFRMAHVELVRADQIGRIGLGLQVWAIVDAEIVHHDVAHAERERGIGSDAQRHPLGRLGGGEIAQRVDHDHFHAAHARVRGLAHVRAGGVTGRVALGGSEENRVVTVFEVGNHRPRRVHDPADQMGAVAAMLAAA